MTKCTSTLLAPAALGNPITAWARTRKEIIACYANGLILSFPSDWSLRRSGRRVSIHSRSFQKQAIELQGYDEAAIQAVRVDDDDNIIAVVGDIGIRIFPSNNRKLEASILKFDLVHQPFVCTNNVVLCSNDEVVVVKAGGYEALVVNLATYAQNKVPITIPRQAVPILHNSNQIVWVTETIDPSTKKIESFLCFSRFKSKDRPQKVMLAERTVNSPIDLLDQDVAFVVGKSKASMMLIRISAEEGRPVAVIPEILWSCRAHRHPIVALRLWRSPLTDLFVITVSESACVKLWKDARCLHIYHLSSTLSFSLGYPYDVRYNGDTATIVADEGLYEVILQV